MRPETQKKYEMLRKELIKYPSLVIAYSGGVDSALLAAIAIDVKVPKVYGYMVHSVLMAERDYVNATKTASLIGLNIKVIEMDILKVDGLSINPKNRCYLCKRGMVNTISAEIAKEGIQNATLVDGLNATDLQEYRPGITATNELAVAHPFSELGITKDEIREIAAELNYAFADRPSGPCLASRVPYGELLTRKNLKMIDDAESCLYELGFANCRVRMHGNLARIEVPSIDFNNIIEYSGQIVETFKDIGFTYVSMDIEGFRSGSMDETKYVQTIC